MRYNGTLIYEDSRDIFELRRFEPRGDQIAFSGMTTWEGSGLWSVEAVAYQIGTVFRTRDAKCRQGSGPLLPCCIEFEIHHRGDELYVAGAWSERGEQHDFHGTLEPVEQAGGA